MKPAFRMLVIAAAFALLVSACGGSSDASPETAAVDDPTTVAADQPTAEAGAEPSADAEPSGEAKTLDEYLGVAAGFVRGGGGPGGGGGFNNEQFIEEQRLIEQEIQICMQAQGFEYVPSEQGGGIRVFVGQQDQGLSPEEYAATQGFGISTGFDAILEGDIDFSVDADPNTEYLNTLSEGEADAWIMALQGEPPERNEQGQLVDPETGGVIVGGRGAGRIQGGCSGDAQVKVRGDFSVLGELEDEFEELDTRIAADPRIAEINREWADCIRGAGFGYETLDEARSDIQSQFLPIIFSFFGRGPGQGPGDGGGQEGGRLGALAELELTAEQEAELQALQDEEIAIAVASLECNAGTDDEVAEITARYEAEFVENNRETLEAISG